MTETPPQETEEKRRSSSKWLNGLIGTAGSGGDDARAEQRDFLLRLPPESLNQEGGRLVEMELRGLPDAVEVMDATRFPGGWRVGTITRGAISLRLPASFTPAFPIALTVRSGFAEEPGATPWFEMFGFNVEAFEPVEETTPQAKAETTTEQKTQPSMGPAVIIDLDVSIGIDDPDVLATMTVTFSGLPTGAWMTVGARQSGGKWQVPATELGNLAVVFSEDIAAFDLDIELDTGDGETQTATIHVVNDTIQAGGGGQQAMIRLASPDGGAPIRFKVFADGELLCDRVISWPDGATQPVDLGVAIGGDTAATFEFLIRTESIRSGEDAPLAGFLTLEMGEHVIRPDSQAISGRSDLNGDMRIWRGDLIIDMTHAFDDPQAEDVVSPTADSDQDLMPDTGPERGADAPAAAEEPTPETTAEAESEEPPMPLEPETHEPENEVLTVVARAADLRRPGFLDELRQLRDFIALKSDGTEPDYYGRLGVNVGKWRELDARGAAGDPIDLDPRFPSLAPPGGRDNDRAYHPLLVSEHLRRLGATLEISGLAPGALLNRGINLGDGTWRVPATALVDTHILLPSGSERAVALRVTIPEAVNGDPSISTRIGSVIAGASSDVFRQSDPNKRSIPFVLEPEVFDERGFDELSVTVGDVPPGVLLTRGKNHGQGVWTFDCRSGARIVFVVTSDSGPFTVTVTCVAMDNQTGDSTVNTRRIMLDPETGDVVTGTVEAA